MPAKREKKATTKVAEITRALEEHTEENTEIAEALELMKQAQTVRHLPLQVIDRFSYHSVE